MGGGNRFLRLLRYPKRGEFGLYFQSRSHWSDWTVKLNSNGRRRLPPPPFFYLNTREFAAFIAPGSSRNFDCAAGSLLTTPRRRGRSSWEPEETEPWNWYSLEKK